jgi:hypothetical protein
MSTGESMTAGEIITRSQLLRRGALGAAIGAAALAVPGLALADVSHGSEQIREIYQLQAAFHWAKSHALTDPTAIDRMVSLWTDDCTLTSGGKTMNGQDDVRAFFLEA